MPLFGKKDGKRDGEGLSQKEIDAFKSKNADLIASAPPPEPTTFEQPAAEEPDARYRPDLRRYLRAIPSDETPPLASAAASGAPLEVSGPGGDGGADDSTEDDDSAGSEGDGSDDVEDDDSAGSEGDGSDGAKDEGPLSDDLMDLFTSEEVVDDDLEALTRDLEDVDMNDVLRLALEVSAKLADRFPRT